MESGRRVLTLRYGGSGKRTQFESITDHHTQQPLRDQQTKDCPGPFTQPHPLHVTCAVAGVVTCYSRAVPAIG